MVKVLINRKPRNGPYGGGNHFLRAFYDYALENGIQRVENLDDCPDVIFIFHPESEDGGISLLDARKHKFWRPNTKIITRVNECDARKNTGGVDIKWIDMSEHIVHAFFVSEWMKDYFLHPQKQLPGLALHPWCSTSGKGWKCNSNEVILNGVDRSRFQQQEKLSKINGKINVVCAHWSDNEMKGQKTYEFLDSFVERNPEFTFTFIGRTKARLPNSTIIPPLDPLELSKELTKYDICVNGSMFDPGPNAVIESIAAGLPTYVTVQGGGGVDFAGKNYTFENLEHLEKILLEKNYTRNEDIFESWNDVMKKVFDRIKSL